MTAGPASATPIPGQYIVVLNDSADAPAVEAKHERQATKITRRYRSDLKGYAAQLSDAALNAVRADPNVAFVQQDQTVTGGPQPKKSDQALPNAVFDEEPVVPIAQWVLIQALAPGCLRMGFRLRARRR